MELNLNDPGVNRYLQVYNYYKDLILTGKLSAGTKLPSIRRCSMQLQLSKTTVEAAYLLLAAEGYIISRPQSGYYVTDFSASGSPEPWKEEQTRKTDMVQMSGMIFWQMGEDLAKTMEMLPVTISTDIRRILP